VGFHRGCFLLPARLDQKGALRAATHGIEAVGDALPSPWGDRIEIVLRELGGFIWIQITALIIFIRVVF